MSPLARKNFQIERFIGRLSLFVLATLFAICIYYWLRSHSIVWGPDFLFYLLTSRDLVFGIDPIPYNLGYYPGVYEFWKASYRLADGDMYWIQWHYLSVVMANGLLVGLILWRTSRDLLITLFASICYFILASRCEAIHGITEPLGTLPVLAALAFIFPSEHLSLKQLSWLGIGLALSIFIKQQCGLLALGVIGIWIAETRDQSAFIKKIVSYLPRAVFVTVVTTAVLIALFYLEGSGVARIFGGLHAANVYEAQGTILSHLSGFRNALRGFFELFLLATFLTLLAKSRSQYKRNLNLILFCVFAALFSMVQFWKRGYLHYGLIPLPFIVIAVSSVLHQFDWSGFKKALTKLYANSNFSHFSLRNIFLCFVCLYLFINTGMLKSLFHPLPTTRLDPAGPIQSICQYLKPDADVFVYPPVFNEVHYLCKTRTISSKLSYGWYPLDRKWLSGLLNEVNLEAVVIMKDDKQALLNQVEKSDFTALDFAAQLAGKSVKIIDLPAARIFLLRQQ